MGFFGKAAYHEDADNGWEHCSAAQEPEDYCAGDWAKIIRRAQSLGADVQFTTKGIKITHGKSEGTFKDYRGGVRLAEQFLEEIVA